ncbi:MAG: sulfate adenylyltransferase subunit CysD [Bdellovibrionota bacterium]
MDKLTRLEQQSIFIIREAYATVKNLGMLWSIGKDSTVVLWLTRKAFFGHVPLPLIHIDTSFKIPEMIQYRDELAREWELQLLRGQNSEAIARKETFPDGTIDRIRCCRTLKTMPLAGMVDGSLPRFQLNLETGNYEPYENREPFGGLILGIRADEEGTRSKERHFSPRTGDNNWKVAEQPPELWGYFNTEFPPGAHVRVHPLLDWTELDVWEYIKREAISTVGLYYDQGAGTRYRSLGCAACTSTICSSAKNVDEIIAELREGALAKIPERSGRAQDKDDAGGLETLRKDGYM